MTLLEHLELQVRGKLQDIRVYLCVWGGGKTKVARPVSLWGCSNMLPPTPPFLLHFLAETGMSNREHSRMYLSPPISRAAVTGAKHSG